MLGNYQFAQITIFIFLSELNLIYLVCFKPFKDSKTNSLEIFNELTIFLSGMVLTIFTDFVENLDIKFYGGYCMIGIMLFNFVANLVLMSGEFAFRVIIAIKKVISKIKVRRAARFRKVKIKDRGLNKELSK